ncbi:DUF1295 domain-containing protein [Acholeplasma sp. OttesenSCG-928-E16]|nr:DUF1295 domain-containing protein [Acholeplasma sp. OttesenSCG-928-E16]
MNKATSLILVGIFYLFAYAIGFFFSFLMKNYLDLYINLFLGTIISTIAIYLFNLLFKNASLYDPYWSVQPCYLIFCFYIIYGDKYPFNPIHLIVLLPLLFWAIRLTINWGNGFSDMSFEDWRYKMLKEKTTNRVLRELTVLMGIMIIPTICVYLGTAPLFTSFMKEGVNQLLFYIIGATIILLGTILQIVSDYQMLKFRKQKTGKNIDTGLWKYSRHPNYLGELLIWTGVFIASLNHFDIINIFGVLTIYFLFFSISIPMAEKRYLNKYVEYQDYKKRTSMLLILPKRKPKEYSK